MARTDGLWKCDQNDREADAVNGQQDVEHVLQDDLAPDG
jgi:hypothetical protein